jgi:hypothetical protein
MYATFVGNGNDGNPPEDHLIDSVTHVRVFRNADYVPLSASISYKGGASAVIRSSGRLTIWHRDGRTTIYDLIGQKEEKT